MPNAWKKVNERQRWFFGIFYVLVAVDACLLVNDSSKVNAASEYDYHISIHANYSVKGCKVSGDEAICSFNVEPEKELDKQEGYGNPPGQKLYIDVEPTNNSYMEKVNEAYLGYWQPWSKKLQDRQTPSYEIRAKKSDLQKKEIKGDITTIEYTKEICFHTDLHWNDMANGYVTHGINDFCRDIKASETVPSKFSGKTESGSVSTGWVSDYKTKIRYISDCSAIEGCEAEFVHSLKRTAGYGSSDYEISRTSNYWRSDGTGVEPKILKTSEESFDSNNSKTVYKETVRLVPGQVVCESIDFRINSNNSHRTTGICVVALGDVDTTIDEKVKNNEMGGDFQEKVYAKPEDNITYRTIYSPTLQYAYYLKPQYMKIDDGGIFTPEYHSAMLGKAFDVHRDSDKKNWNNSFSVMGDSFWLSKNYVWDVGDNTEHIIYNDHKVYSSEVGKILAVTARTNTNNNIKTTPGNIAFSQYLNNVLARVGTGDIRSSAEVWVPYNFYNETRITDINDVVYAGEESGIDYEIITGLKKNGKLNNARYATMVKRAKWRVEVCYGENYQKCSWTEGGSGDLHKNEGIYDESIKNDGGTKTRVPIPDVAAGTKIRVRSAVYPKDSGADDNIKVDYYDPDDPDAWAYSEPVELVVAKKPSFQVWGGNVYSAGDIKTLVADKLGYGGEHFFGSWTELGLVVSGTVTGMSSGAGMGYANNDSAFENGVWPGYHPMQEGGKGNNNVVGNSLMGGGKGEDSFCLRSTLTFANDGCANSAGFKGAESIDSGEDRHDLISGFLSGENRDDFELRKEVMDDSSSGSFNWFNFASSGINDDFEVTPGSNTYYYHYSGNSSDDDVLDVEFFLPWEKSIGKSKTIVIDSDQSINIASNIKYSNSGYERIEDIPKVIIYSAKDINIACDVDEIDAVLIAEHDINTCSSGNKNSSIRSIQLKINGATISDTLTLNRTYGAATVYNSIIPAEIINYDTSLYLWANKQTDVTKTGKIATAYQTELSPRY